MEQIINKKLKSYFYLITILIAIVAILVWVEPSDVKKQKEVAPASVRDSIVIDSATSTSDIDKQGLDAIKQDLRHALEDALIHVDSTHVEILRDLLKQPHFVLDKLDFWKDDNDQYRTLSVGDYKINFAHIESTYSTKMQILKDGQIINEKELMGYLTSISRLDYNGDTYYFIPAWSGGAHCCTTITPMVYSGSVLKIGTDTEIGDNDLSYFNKSDDIFIKDSSLYFSTKDTRFRYFDTSFGYSGPMFFTAYYKFDKRTGNLILVNKEFKKYYGIDAKNADAYIGVIKKFVAEHNLEANLPDLQDEWLPYFVSRTINKILAGENEKIIWEQFVNDAKYFKVADANDMKRRIIDNMNAWDY